MVKFTQQFEGQLVPEWKHAFVDYCLLKKDLKRMQHALVHGHHDHCSTSGLTNMQQTTDQQAQRSSLSQWLFHKLPDLFGANATNDRGVIKVHRKLAGSASRGGDVYETELLDEQFAGDDTDAVVEFFARLDAQLNKVNRFYKSKEKEFLERGESLRKQMDILADLKAARDDPSVASSFTSSGSVETEDESTRYMATATDTDQNEPAMTPQSLETSGTFGMETKSLGLGRSTCGCQRTKNLKINIP